MEETRYHHWYCWGQAGIINPSCTDRSSLLLGPGTDYKSQLYRQVVIAVGARQGLQILVVQTGRHCCWGQADITNPSYTDRSPLLLWLGRDYKSQLHRQVVNTVGARQRLQIPVIQTGRHYCWGQEENTNPSYTDRSSLLFGLGNLEPTFSVL